jgi:hypothetical protein
VDTGVNSAPDLGEHRCRDDDDRSDSTNYREVAEHKLGLPPLPLSLSFKRPNLIGLGSCQGPQPYLPFALMNLYGSLRLRALAANIHNT